MSGANIETLPFDIYVEIFAAIDTFKDVEMLITSSPSCRKFFNTNESSVLVKIVKKTISKEAWETAPTILCYQRHSNDPSIGSNAEGNMQDYKKPVFETPFRLRRTDIRHLLANQRFFESCSEDLPIFTHLYYHNYLDISTTSSRLTVPAVACSMKIGDPLPEELFYKVWIMSFRFEHESIHALARDKPLSPEEYADIQVASRIMCNSAYAVEFGCAPKRKWEAFVNVGRSGFFAFSSQWLASTPGIELNPALFMKAASRLQRIHKIKRWEVRSKAIEFMAGWPTAKVGKLVDKWGLA